MPNEVFSGKMTWELGFALIYPSLKKKDNWWNKHGKMLMVIEPG